MPRRLEEYTFTGPAIKPKYNYDQLFDGQIWQCYPGEDFTVQPTSFVSTMTAAARKRGLRVRTKVMDADGSVVLQAYKPAELDASQATPASSVPSTPLAAPAQVG